MNLTQVVGIVLVTGLALLPTIITSYFSYKNISEPEHEYDYR